jgi:hypothetical protein
MHPDHRKRALDPAIRPDVERCIVISVASVFVVIFVALLLSTILCPAY